MNQINYALFETCIFFKDVLDKASRKMDDLAMRFYQKTNKQ